MPSKLSVIGVILLFLHVTVFGAEDLGAKRMLAERLIRSGSSEKASVIYQELALHPKNTSISSAEDLKQAIRLLRRQNKIRELDTFRDSAASSLSGNRFALEVLAYDYLNDPYHWGYLLDSTFQRGAGKLGNARPVCSFARDRARCLHLLSAAMALVQKDDRDGAFGAFCLKAADAILIHRGKPHPKLLESLTDLVDLPPYEEGHDLRYTVPDSSSYAFPATFKGYTLPPTWAVAKSDGERWRYLLEQAAILGKKPEAQTVLGDFYRSVLGVHRYTDVDPSILDHFKRQCEGLEDTQSLQLSQNQIRTVDLPSAMNYITLYTLAGAKDRLASVYAARGQLSKAAKFLSVRDKDDWLQVSCEFVESGPTIPTDSPKVVLAHRNSGDVQFTGRPIDFDALWTETRQYLESQPRYIDPAEIGFSRLAKRLFGRSGRALAEPTHTWTVQLPKAAQFKRVETAISLPFSKPGLYLVEGNSGDSKCRRIIHLTDLVILRKNLADGVWLQAVSLRTGQPVPNAKMAFLGYTKTFERGTLQVRTRVMEQTANDKGEVILGAKELTDETGRTLHWAVRAQNGEQSAYLDFSPLPAKSPMERPSNLLRGHIMTDHRMYNPSDTVNYCAWIGVAGFAAEPAEALASGQKVKAIISGPDKKQAYSEKHVADENGFLKGSFRLPVTASSGRYFLYVPEAAATISFMVAESAEVVPDLKLQCEQIHIDSGTPLELSLSVTEPHTFVNGFEVVLNIQFSTDGAPSETVFEKRYHIPPGKLADNGLNWKQALAIPTTLERDGVYDITANLVFDGTGYSRTHRVVASKSLGKVTLNLPANFYPAKKPISLTVLPTLADGSATAGTGRIDVVQITGSEKSRRSDHVIHTTKVVVKDAQPAPVSLPRLPAGRYVLKATIFPEKKEEPEPEQEPTEGETTEGEQTPPPKPKPAPRLQSEALTGKHELVIQDKGYVPAPDLDQLTIIPEKDHYSPGDIMRLLVISPVPGGRLTIFLRPAISYTRPLYLTLNGHSTIIDVPIATPDRPNLFVECLTVGNGRLYNAVCSMAILPGEKQINLKADLPASVKAGTELRVPVTAVDAQNPEAIRIITAVYSSLEHQIPEIPDIHKQLRPWVRRHQPWTKSSSDHRYGNLLKAGETGMPRLAFSFLKRNRRHTLPEEPMADTAKRLTPLLHNDQIPRAIYWSEHTLDKKGMTEIAFKAPDEIGEWAVRVWAIGPGLACGEYRGTFETTTTLQATVSLPAVAVVGDRFQADIVVKNVGEDDDFMALELTPSEGLSIDAEFEKGFPLKADESKQLDPVIIARKAGLHKVSLELTSASGERKVQTSVQVYDYKDSVSEAKQFALFCDETIEPLALPANTARVNWAVGLPGVLLQVQKGYNRDDLLVPEHLLVPVLIEAMTLKAVKAAGYSVSTDPKKSSEPVYWDKADLDSRTDDIILKLTGIQNPDGGWSWSGSKGVPSDPDTTATIIHSLQVARTYGLPISRSSLFRAIQYLRGLRSQRLVALEDPKVVCNDMDATVFLALIESKDRNHKMMPFLERDFANLSFVGKCRFVLGLRKIFYYDKIGPLMAELRESITGSEDQLLQWIDSERPLQDTAEFAQVLNNAEPGSDLSKAVIRWLITQRKTGNTWPSRSLDRLCAEAIASFVKQAEEDKPTLKASEAGDKPGTSIFEIKESTPYYNLVGTADLKKSDKSITWNIDGFGDLFAYTPAKAEPEKGIETAISFASEDGRTRGFVIGDIIDTALTLTSDTDLDRIALRCVLPAGIVPLTAGNQVICSGPMPINRKDGNTVTFMARRLPKGEHVIHFRAVATYPGTFSWHSPQLHIDGYPVNHKKRRKGTCSIGKKPAKE